MRLTDPRSLLRWTGHVTILVGLMFGLTNPATAQQCTSCAAAVRLPSSQVSANIASGTTSRFIITLNGVGAGLDVSNGSYEAWSVDPWAPTPANPHKPQLYSSLATYLPSSAQGLSWDKVNWLINHKRGTVADMQATIWSVLSGAADPGLTTEGLALLADAEINAADYTPGPGDDVAVLAYGDGSSGSPVYTILEVPVPDCGKIGDWVWDDVNYDGVQDPGESGINNVTLVLTKVSETGERVIGTTVTTTKDGQRGYYQFKGLCPGTYRVTVDLKSPPILAMTPTLTGTGTVGPMLDSNENPSRVIQPSLDASDQSVDFGFFIPAQRSNRIEIKKTASAATVLPLAPVTYTYVVKNSGTSALTGISVTDDNGTPSNPWDDFTVGKKETLAAGESVTFTATRVPPMPHCAIVNNQILGIGTLVPEFLTNGDLKVTFRQNQVYVDNTYGATASASWLSGHTFSQFTGSDRAEFRFFDKTGKVVLDFYMDYISAAATTRYPSGYGTLGPFGGDGGWISGNQAWVLDYSTTMTRNMNQSPAYYGFTTNSPAETSDLFKNWDLFDGYTVTVSKDAFGAAGFGNVIIPFIHNSPSKLGKGAASPVPCNDSTVTNTATVVAATSDYDRISASDSASVIILAPGPSTTTTTTTKLPPPPPVTTCTATSAIKSDFNATLIKSGNYVWFNAVMNPGTVPAADTKVAITDGTISFTKDGKQYTLQVPDSLITFSAADTASKTTFANGRWETKVPLKYSGNTFMAGFAFPMPVDMKDVKGVTWTARFTASQKISIDWKWAAAVYTRFTENGVLDYEGSGIKSADGNMDALFKNADHAGTPSDFKEFVIGGARGGGGSNYTGSYSGTGKLSYTCQ